MIPPGVPLEALTEHPESTEKVGMAFDPWKFTLLDTCGFVRDFRRCSQLRLTFPHHNDNVVVMLPDFDSSGALPQGIHDASWDEIVARFGWTEYRRELLAGLRDVLGDLQLAGCRRAYLDGSFITDREVPGDYDLCWEMDGVSMKKLHPVLHDVDPPRAAQQARYRGDILPNVVEGQTGAPFVDFFQRNKVTGGVKGIVAINIEELT